MLEARSCGAGRRSASLAAAVCAAVLLAACGADHGGETPSVPSAMGRPTDPAGAAAAADAQAADLELIARGEILSFSCRPCHGLAPGEESPMGPHLYGVFGRPAGQLPGFDYSSAMRESGIVWTEEVLDAWLARPDSFLPGTTMSFAGFRSAEDRRALIAYLRMRTAPSEHAP